ncbi:DUF934 domain-containing protein [Ramlibacter alkalitolerans]|uniref:DUF934 domain-containing protein n=1 Tax=Ramlibacter alkalitolerans TaxID=2039631 RepID=A0ABS1JKG4_9BURK|nr:DUF934 domain-containing protein [Ramlibacter alkalitolerans]MBL0424724.1 DUF934 domain-containing protein [Ramlibacter alkalitolerans]
MTARVIRILQAEDVQAEENVNVLVVANDADVAELPLEGVDRIELHFPKFSDGRAFSQAYLLRRRRKFTGDIRATGDVLIDQLVQMQRTGFSSAVLKEGKDIADAQRQFDRYAAFYQADVVTPQPLFARS